MARHYRLPSAEHLRKSILPRLGLPLLLALATCAPDQEERTIDETTIPDGHPTPTLLSEDSLEAINHLSAPLAGLVWAALRKVQVVRDRPLPEINGHSEATWSRITAEFESDSPRAFYSEGVVSLSPSLTTVLASCLLDRVRFATSDGCSDAAVVIVHELLHHFFPTPRSPRDGRAQELWHGLIQVAAAELVTPAVIEFLSNVPRDNLPAAYRGSGGEIEMSRDMSVSRLSAACKTCDPNQARFAVLALFASGVHREDLGRAAVQHLALRSRSKLVRGLRRSIYGEHQVAKGARRRINQALSWGSYEKLQWALRSSLTCIQDSTRPNLTIYSADWCGYCKVLEEQLREQGIEYERVNVDDAGWSPGQGDGIKISGVPALYMDSRPVRHLDTRKILSSLGSARAWRLVPMTTAVRVELEATDHRASTEVADAANLPWIDVGHHSDDPRRARCTNTRLKEVELGQPHAFAVPYSAHLCSTCIGLPEGWEIVSTHRDGLVQVVVVRRS